MSRAIKKWFGEAAAHGSEFGIVLAKDDTISTVGCTVVVEEVGNPQPDGSLLMSPPEASGGSESWSLDRERDYLRADVEFFEDEDPAPERPSFQIAHSVPDSSDPQNAILRSRSETERMQ